MPEVLFASDHGAVLQSVPWELNLCSALFLCPKTSLLFRGERFIFQVVRVLHFSCVWFKLTKDGESFLQDLEPVCCVSWHSGVVILLEWQSRGLLSRRLILRREIATSATFVLVHTLIIPIMYKTNFWRLEKYVIFLAVLCTDHFKFDRPIKLLKWPEIFITCCQDRDIYC